jgi:hypothetical protein
MLATAFGCLRAGFRLFEDARDLFFGKARFSSRKETPYIGRLPRNSPTNGILSRVGVNGHRFSVDRGFTPAELVLVLIGAADETAFRLAIRVNAGEKSSYSYD